VRRHLHRHERRFLIVGAVAILAVALVAGAAIALTSGDDEDDSGLRPSRVQLDDRTVAAGRPLATRVKLRGREGSAPTTVTWHLSFDDDQGQGDVALVGGGLGDTPAARPAIPRDTPVGSYRVLACTGADCAASDERVIVTGSGAPRAAGAETLIAAGDIASCEEEGDEATAPLVRALPGTIAALGDIAYEEGLPREFRECYDPTWGTERDRTRPVPGNHEYATGVAPGYFRYFGDAAGEPGDGWYSYELGDWHVIALNSQCEAVGGCDADSPQGRWLADDLEENRSRCTLAYWHHPRFSSGEEHGDHDQVAPFWEVLHEHDADVVLSGHEHNYERFAPQTPDGKPSPDGIRQFVVGTGGKAAYEFAEPKPTSEVRHSKSHGVLELTLRRGGYDWRFLPADGDGFTDSGRGSCR
jgi:acid phosphatase type 7